MAQVAQNSGYQILLAEYNFSFRGEKINNPKLEKCAVVSKVWVNLIGRIRN